MYAYSSGIVVKFSLVVHTIIVVYIYSYRYSYSMIVCYDDSQINNNSNSNDYDNNKFVIMHLILQVTKNLAKNYNISEYHCGHLDLDGIDRHTSTHMSYYMI